jgi:hypothetical protein
MSKTTPRATPEEIEIAKLECIEAISKSIEACQKRFELESEEYKRVNWKKHNDSIHKRRIEILQLKGEYPEIKEKKSKHKSMRAEWNSLLLNLR